MGDKSELTCGSDLLCRVAHDGRGAELTLFDLYDPPGLRGCHQQVGLPAQKRWDLDDVRHLCHRRRLLGSSHK